LGSGVSDIVTLVDKIKELWQHPSVHRIASIKHLISGTTEEVQGRSLHQKQQWVVRVEAAIQRYQTMTTITQYHQEREGMRIYLSQFKK
jgi:hypothetical protein